ncbi:hypothetical protein QUF70_12450 [Desulfobacterales bacterium HSG17]|nr:hypothetical protein [Desulfobacterales bacterium HSG17]
MELLFSVKLWIIIGLCLSIIEVFSGLFFALSFGIAGFIMAGLLKVWPTLLTEWYEVIFIYSVISLLVASLAWKKFIKTQAQQQDIND